MYSDKENIIAYIKKVIIDARTGSYSDASSALNLMLQELQNILKSNIVPESNVKKITYSLETLFIMQKNEDWVAVADVLEYELLMLMKNI